MYFKSYDLLCNLNKSNNYWGKNKHEWLCTLLLKVGNFFPTHFGKNSAEKKKTMLKFSDKVSTKTQCLHAMHKTHDCVSY